MIARLTCLAAIGWLALATGCGTVMPRKNDLGSRARFFLEAQQGEGTAVTLPQSGVQLVVSPKAVLTEGDIINVELVQVDLGKCLLFQLTPAAARDFYRLSVTNQGRRLVLFVDQIPLGARRIDGPIVDGMVFVFVEWPDTALPALVDGLKKTSVELQKEAVRKG